MLRTQMSLANGFQSVSSCRRMKTIYWYHLRMQQCWISQDMKKMMKAVHSIREMMKNHIQAMEFLLMHGFHYQNHMEKTRNDEKKNLKEIRKQRNVGGVEK